MLGVGVVGAVFLGLVQGNAIEEQLEHEHPQIHEQVVVASNIVFGS